MGKQNKNYRSNYSARHQPYTRPRKTGTPGWLKWLAAILIVSIVGIVAVWQLSLTGLLSQSPSGTPQYPAQATGVFYLNPTTTDNGTKVEVPLSFVKDKKIVFLDVPLQSTAPRIDYKNRILLLSQYKSGNYLPLILLYTPSGNVKVGIRTCEPCAGFSMHIGTSQGRAVLVCDVCNTTWDIETFNGISGGCPDYPPPQVSFLLGNNIEIDVSELGITVSL